MNEMNEIPKIPETEEDWIRGAEIRMMPVNAYKRLVRLRMAAPPERPTPPVLAAPENSAALPELPEPRHRGPDGTGSYFDSYTADQLRAYGQACAAAERASERECIIQLCEEEAARWQYPSHGNAAVTMLKSLIRART